MTKDELNKPMVYQAESGIRFEAVNHMLEGGVTVTAPPWALPITSNQLAASCVEFGHWHGTAVLPHLFCTGFPGYDCVMYVVKFDVHSDADR